MHTHEVMQPIPAWDWHHAQLNDSPPILLACLLTSGPTANHGGHHSIQSEAKAHASMHAATPCTCKSIWLDNTSKTSITHLNRVSAACA